MFSAIDEKRSRDTGDKWIRKSKTSAAQCLRQKIDFRLTAADYLANVSARHEHQYRVEF